MNRYDFAKQMYESIGADVENALSIVSEIPVSIHCWQGDDVTGFENAGEALTGGIQTTGDYPGRARNFEELTEDFSRMLKVVPGKKRINLHSSYAIQDGRRVDRDALVPEQFDKWISFAKEHGLGIDFNPTYFSHPMMKDGLTLSSPDEDVRNFWIRHSIACRKIAAYIAKKLNDTVLCNIWIPDGYKNNPVDKAGPRLRLKQSLDTILSEREDGVIDCVESKLFGIGAEAYTVGSHEFYLSYAARRNDVFVLLDNGHFHAEEKVSDKISAILPFFDKIPLHITRGLHWDSDHVVLLDDRLREITDEIVACRAWDKVIIGLDYFDASINRIAAWIIGVRCVEKALLQSLLQPWDKLAKLQNEGNMTQVMALTEEYKTLPFGDIWAEYCRRENVPAQSEWLPEISRYEKDILLKRI